MCGIAGIISRKTPLHRATFDRMVDALASRGPDGRATKYFDNDLVALGHRRLAIVDLSPNGAQPMCNENGDIWLTFNGEIYNHRQLRRRLEATGHQYRSNCDSESILHAYEEWGDRCVTKFRGIFSFAVWDGRRKRLFCARDHLGVKPFYYADLSEQFVFASQPRAILAMESFEARLDSQAFVDYLSYGIVPDDRAAFQGMRKLPPAHTLTWEQGRVHSAQYWKVRYSPEITNFDEAKRSVEEAIEETVRLQLMSDVPVATYLSGGIDSSLITGIAAELYGRPMESFTIGFQEESSDERPYARLVVNHCGTIHHEAVLRRSDALDLIDDVVEAYDEPYALGAAFPMISIAQLTKAYGIKVVLAGDGADELFAGYRHYDQFETAYHRRGLKTAKRVANPLRHLRARFRDGAFDPPADYFPREGMMPSHTQRRLLAEDICNHTDPDTKWRLRKYFDDHLRAVTAGQIMDIQTYLPDEILVKVDRASMAYGIEARVPFLDPRLVELAFSIDTNLMYRDGQRKALLKEAARRWLPDDVLTGRKKGFSIPLAAWLLEGGLREKFIDEMLEGYLVQAGFLKYNGLQRVLETIKPSDVWQLYFAERWARRWCSDSPNRQRQSEPANLDVPLLSQ